eukprot:gene7884-8736_t
MLVIAAYFSSREFRRRPSTSCLIMLTIADLITCVSAIPYYTTGLLLNNFDMTHIQRYTDICKVTIFIITTAGIVRILAFTAMSVDRFVAIAYPFWYSNSSSRFRVLILAIVISIYAGLSALPAVLVDGWLVYNAENEALCRFTSPPNSIVYTAPMVVVNFTLPTLAVIVMNCRVYKIAVKQLRRVATEIGNHCTICNLARSMATTPENQECGNETRDVERRESTKKKWLLDGKQSKKTKRRSNKLQVKITPRIISSEGGEIRRIAPCTDRNQTIRHGRIQVQSCDGSNTKAIRNDKDCTTGFKEEKTTNCLNTTREDKRHSVQVRSKLRSKGNLSIMSWLLKHNAGLNQVGIEPRCKHSSRHNSKELAIAISTLLLAFAFTITWTPYVITRLIITIWKGANSPRLQAYTSATTVINSGLNPVIILCTRKEVRRILFKKIGWLKTDET